MEIISKTILEHIVIPELERRWKSNDIARDYYPLIIQILFEKTEKDKDELKIYISFDSDATGNAIIDRKRELLSVNLIRDLLDKNQILQKILVDDTNIVAYITWVRETERNKPEYGVFCIFPRKGGIRDKLSITFGHFGTSFCETRDGPKTESQSARLMYLGFFFP
jgi:hypothetical protein